MTEKELRQSYVNAAISYLGCKESDGLSLITHLDVYKRQATA